MIAVVTASPILFITHLLCAWATCCGQNQLRSGLFPRPREFKATGSSQSNGVDSDRHRRCQNFAKGSRRWAKAILTHMLSAWTFRMKFRHEASAAPSWSCFSAWQRRLHVFCDRDYEGDIITTCFITIWRPVNFVRTPNHRSLSSPREPQYWALAERFIARAPAVAKAWSKPEIAVAAMGCCAASGRHDRMGAPVSAVGFQATIAGRNYSAGTGEGDRGTVLARVWKFQLGSRGLLKINSVSGQIAGMFRPATLIEIERANALANEQARRAAPAEPIIDARASGV